jgi:hypothetical protein
VGIAKKKNCQCFMQCHTLQAWKTFINVLGNVTSLEHGILQTSGLCFQNALLLNNILNKNNL